MEIRSICIGLLLGLIIGSGGIYTLNSQQTTQLHEQIQQLQIDENEEIRELAYQIQQTVDEYDSLLGNYSGLIQAHDLLLSENVELSSDKRQLELERTTHEAILERLKNETADLQDSSSRLKVELYEMRLRYNESTGRYEELQKEYESVLAIDHDSFEVSYRSLVEKINLHSQHRTEQDMLIITPNDQAVELLVQELTGGWENTSDWNEYWDDIMILFCWVEEKIEYDIDGYFPKLSMNPAEGFEYQGEMWQFPNQTLLRMTGDCEDQAILLASMIRNYNNKTDWVECIEFQGEGGGHVALYMASNRKIFIMDPTQGYYTNNGPPDYVDSHKDIYEEVNKYLNTLRDSLPNIYVNYIFADYYQKNFDSTSGFINWLYQETS